MTGFGLGKNVVARSSYYYMLPKLLSKGETSSLSFRKTLGLFIGEDSDTETVIGDPSDSARA